MSQTYQQAQSVHASVSPVKNSYQVCTIIDNDDEEDNDRYKYEYSDNQSDHKNKGEVQTNYTNTDEKNLLTDEKTHNEDRIQALQTRSESKPTLKLFDKFEQKQEFTSLQTITTNAVFDYNQQQKQQAEESREQLENVMPQKEEQIDPFSVNQNAYVKYLKGIFVMKEILDQIQQQNLLDLGNQKHVQFLFLISTRILNHIKFAFETFSKIANEGNNDALLEICFIIDANLSKAHSKFKVYDQILEELRSKLSNKLSKIFTSQASIQGKEKFLDGFEGLDYNEKEQVQFTHCNYIQIVLNSKQFKDKHFKNHRLKKVLRGYRLCCLIDQKQIKSETGFKNRIQEILIDQ